MSPTTINQLVELGAQTRCREYLKKLALPQRMETLKAAIPWVNETPKTLKFYRDNFSQEIGALLKAEQDIEKAVGLYRRAKVLG